MCTLLSNSECKNDFVENNRLLSGKNQMRQLRSKYFAAQHDRKRLTNLTLVRKLVVGEWVGLL